MLRRADSWGACSKNSVGRGGVRARLPVTSLAETFGVSRATVYRTIERETSN
jgi:hypothetical protein